MFKSTFTSKQAAAPVRTLTETTNTVDPTYVMMEALIALENAGAEILQNNMYAGFLYDIDSNPLILEEGFKDMMQSAGEFFKKLGVSIVNFFKNIFSYLTSYIRNFDKFINDNKDKLMGLNPDKKVKGYTYTLDQVMPSIAKLTPIVQEFSKEVFELDKISMGELKQRRTDFDDKEGMDLVRASIIGQSSPIAEGEFEETCRAILRNGAKEKEEILLDSTLLQTMISEYSTIKASLSTLRRDQIAIEKLINDIRKFFEKGPEYRYEKGNHNAVVHGAYIDDKQTLQKDLTSSKSFASSKTDVIAVTNYYYSLRFHQSKEISKYVMRAMINKTDAYKEALKFYESCIRTALFSSSNKEGDK